MHTTRKKKQKQNNHHLGHLENWPVKLQTFYHILWIRHVSMCFIKAGAHASTLHFIGNHDNDPSILLPDHLPEVVHCFRQTTLCGNIPLLWARDFTTDVACNDVVRAHDSGVWVFEDNTCVVNCEEMFVCENSEFSSYNVYCGNVHNPLPNSLHICGVNIEGCAPAAVVWTGIWCQPHMTKALPFYRDTYTVVTLIHKESWRW